MHFAVDVNKKSIYLNGYLFLSFSISIWKILHSDVVHRYTEIQTNKKTSNTRFKITWDTNKWKTSNTRFTWKPWFLGKTTTWTEISTTREENYKHKMIEPDLVWMYSQVVINLSQVHQTPTRRYVSFLKLPKLLCSVSFSFYVTLFFFLFFLSHSVAKLYHSLSHTHT